MITDLLFYLVATPAVLLMGLSKGGFAGLGLMSLPLMALVISPVQAAAIMLPILITQDVVTVWAYRHSWDGRQGSRINPVYPYDRSARGSDVPRFAGRSRVQKP